VSDAIEHVTLRAPGVEPAGDPIEVEAPWDRSVIATIDRTDWKGADHALATAESLYRDRSKWLNKGERIAILERVSEKITEQREFFALEAAREGGKPYVDSLVELDRAANTIKLCAVHLQTQAGTGIPMGLNAASDHKWAFTRHEPIGVVLAFSAFNHPFNLIAHQVGPAVAAGCPVIVKPAEATPLSCYRLVALFHEAGLPEEWCQAIMTTDYEVSGRMVSDPRVGFFTFIGSDRVGWTLRSKLAPGTRAGMEHGGASPVLVGPGADLPDMLPRLARGAFYHSGQVCVSVQRVFAPTAQVDEVANGLAEQARSMVVGDPTDPATHLGPLIRPAEVDRVEAWVREAIEGGATVVAGGSRISETCFEPTVLINPPADADVSTKEIFGPVVCVYGYDDVDEAIDRANSLPYPFQAAVVTSDLNFALKAVDRIDAAAVMVNEHTAFRVDWMPFAGHKRSGLGAGGVAYSMEDMQTRKLVVIRSEVL
jgi:acyl-CoA reductase-like NAD-dependent aldehyde dehydrogenase